MRRLMGSDTAYGVLVLAFVVAMLAWIYWPDKPKTVEKVRTGPTLYIQTPPLTPLQARRAKRTSAARSPDSKGRGTRGTATGTQQLSRSSPSAKSPTRIGANKRRSPSKQPKATAPPRRRRPAPQNSPQPSQQPSHPPSQPSPEPGVTVPLPSVCLPPVKVNC